MDGKKAGQSSGKPDATQQVRTVKPSTSAA
jgi:hypothetical protein